jgi:type III restriction enzyme
LQTEIEELGVKFGVLDIGMFVNISYKEEVKIQIESGVQILAVEHKKINNEGATEILKHFQEKNYIDASGKIKEALRSAIVEGTIDIPDRFEAARDRIISILTEADKNVVIKPYKKQVLVKRKDEMFTSPEFLLIWEKMKQKTIFRININITELHKICVERIKKMEAIKPTRIIKEEARLDLQKKGVLYEPVRQNFSDIVQEFLLPDVISTIAAACKMPRKEVGEILLEANRWPDFVNNPQSFVEEITKIIKSAKIDVFRS